MPRVPLTEYKAKEIVCASLGLAFQDVAFDSKTEAASSLYTRLDPQTRYVVKIDEGVKKRFKSGLVGLNLAPQEVANWIQKTTQKGHTNFIICPFVPHKKSEERYLSLERVRTGILLRYSSIGGVDIENGLDRVEEHTMVTGTEKYVPQTGIDLAQLVRTFNDAYMSFLEINPFVVQNGIPFLLDLAVEVDSVSSFYTTAHWQVHHTVDTASRSRYPSEQVVHQLAQNSQASFTFTILNPDGTIFLLLSGGGASITLADEFHNLGLGDEVANYGEYSGNPTTEESYIYTKALLESLLASKGIKKKLIIGGGVANFTDVYNTFKGLLQAMEEVKGDLKKQRIKVYVRRGGPNQEKGLAAMRAFLEKNELLGVVTGPEVGLGEIARMAVENLTN